MRIPTLATLIATTALGVSLPATGASAQSVASGVERAGQQVSDADLGTMRGKFITPSGINYFGVQMQTSWQGSDGVTTNAVLLFSVDFAKNAANPEGTTPTIKVGWTRDGDSSLDVSGFGGAASGNYVALPVGGLNSVQGAVQSQQIAGSDNSTLNGMRVAIVPASSVESLNSSGLTDITASESHRFADGDTLDFTVADNRLGVAMGSGADQVRQSIGAGQAAQHLVLSSNGNSLRNQMNVVVGYGETAPPNSVALQNALSSMKGTGF